jgi:NAD(P)-dependent dehydrogenase (short-subunit alcohol dehydrogenase family)
MMRFGTTNDVVDAVMFFIQATTYITGETIRVDGGHHLV